MAITANNYGPADHLPYPANNTWQYLRLAGDGTEVMIPAGAGILKAVYVDVAGTTADFYDTPAGGTADGTTLAVGIQTSVTGLRYEGPVAFSKGMTVITGGANSDILIVFYGRPTVQNARTFGV